MIALFYRGLVCSKHIMGTIMQSVVMLCLVRLNRILAGYSLAFGIDKGGSSEVVNGWAQVGFRKHSLDAPGKKGQG